MDRRIDSPPHRSTQPRTAADARPAVTPECACSWIDRFASRLLQLRPDLGVTTAVRYAVLSIHEVACLDPGAAAEDLARSRLLGEPCAH